MVAAGERGWLCLRPGAESAFIKINEPGERSQWLCVGMMSAT